VVNLKLAPCLVVNLKVGKNLKLPRSSPFWVVKFKNAKYLELPRW
jgi:hypothetical protein